MRKERAAYLEARAVGVRADDVDAPLGRVLSTHGKGEEAGLVACEKVPMQVVRVRS